MYSQRGDSHDEELDQCVKLVWKDCQKGGAITTASFDKTESFFVKRPECSFEAWILAERALGEIFDQIDQDVEFSQRVKWGSVEVVINILDIIHRIRLEILRKEKTNERFGKLLSSMAYSCQIMVRFSREGNLTPKQSISLKHKLGNHFEFYSAALRELTESSASVSAGTQLITLVGLPQNFQLLLKPTHGLVAYLSLPTPPLLLLCSFLSSYCMAEWNVGMASSLGLGDLVLLDKVAMRYQGKGISKEAKLSLIRFAEKSIAVFEPQVQLGDKALDEGVKLAMEQLWPGEGVLEKLECLDNIKTSNFKELLRFKQSLNLSSPGDLLFDTLLDLFRLSLPQSSSSPSLTMISHKLSHPTVVQLLTPALLASLRPLLSQSCVFGYLLLFPPVLPQNMTLYLSTAGQWLYSLRNASELPLLTWLQELDKGFEKAEKFAKDNDRAELLRCSYLLFYLGRNINTQLGMDNLARIFRLGDESQRLWTLDEDSGTLFLDAIDTGFQVGPEGSQVIKMVRILATPSIDDTDKVKALKALIRVRVSLHNKEDDPSTVSSLPGLVEQSLKILPIQEVYMALKSELMRPEVYYLFFFNLISHFVQSNAQGQSTIHIVLEFLMSLHEDVLKVVSNTEEVPLWSPLPTLYKMLRPHLSSPLPDRAWTLLFNQFVRTGDNECLALSVEYGGGGQVLLFWGLYIARTNKVLERGAVEGQRILELVKIARLDTLKNPKHIQEIDSNKLSQDELSGRPMDQEGVVTVQEHKVSQIDVEAELDDIDEVKKDLSTTLSCEQLYFVEFVYSNSFEPEHCAEILEESRDNREVFVVLFYAASLTGSPLFNSLLRTHLTQLLSSQTMSLPAIISVYSSLLGSTVSTRELRGYLNQLEGVFDLGKPSDLPSLKPLMLQIAKVKTDFGESLETEVKRIARIVENKGLTKRV